MISGMGKAESREVLRERVLDALFNLLPHLSPIATRMAYGSPKAIVFRMRIECVTGVSEYWH